VRAVHWVGKMWGRGMLLEPWMLAHAPFILLPCQNKRAKATRAATRRGCRRAGVWQARVVALLLDQGMRERISNQVLKQVHGRLPFLAKQIMSRKCPMDNACEIEDGAIDD
jgi:hypothetical protein